jgi:hypothetical protein
MIFDLENTQLGPLDVGALQYVRAVDDLDTSSTTAAEANACCGGRQNPTGKGKPYGHACILCDASPTCWRREPGAAARLASRPHAYPEVGGAKGRDPATRFEIYFVIPSVEDLDTVIALLEAAGAEITRKHREFVVTGPLTPRQATATWQLVNHLDSGTERATLQVRVEPAADVDEALNAMCVEGFDRRDLISWSGNEDHSWWFAQQAWQRELRGRSSR